MKKIHFASTSSAKTTLCGRSWRENIGINYAMCRGVTCQRCRAAIRAERRRK